MDWKYKHFNQAAVFNAFGGTVLEAARAVVAESLGGITDTAEGFVARGRSGWHPAIATVRVMPAPSGTQVAVELLVQRAAGRGYMLFDVGGYYNGQIDKWFLGISQRLGNAQGQTLVSKTTSNTKLRQGCLAGCLVYLVLGACLTIFAIPLDRALLGQSSGSVPGLFAAMALGIAFFAGIAAFLYWIYPDAPASQFIRKRLQRTQN